MKLKIEAINLTPSLARDNIAFTVVFSDLSSVNITTANITEMREWVGDCHWSDDCDTEDFSDVQIIRGVNRFFDGGLEAFLETCSVATAGVTGHN